MNTIEQTVWIITWEQATFFYFSILNPALL